MVRQIIFLAEFPVCQELLDISQMATAFQRISPPLFHPILIVAILLKYSPFTLRTGSFSDAILSRIDEVLKFHDSTIDLHKIFQIPSSCLFLQLSVCPIRVVVLILPPSSCGIGKCFFSKLTNTSGTDAVHAATLDGKGSSVS